MWPVDVKNGGGTPQEIVDKYHTINKKAFEDFGISFDIYHRTSDALHHETAQEFFSTLEADGAFTKQTTQQFYDAEYDQFLADRYVTGTCPKCSQPAFVLVHGQVPVTGFAHLGRFATQGRFGIDQLLRAQR